jgi:hypothetical protein
MSLGLLSSLRVKDQKKMMKKMMMLMMRKNLKWRGPYLYVVVQAFFDVRLNEGIERRGWQKEKKKR